MAEETSGSTEEMAAGGEDMMKITLKSTKESHSIDIRSDATVAELREVAKDIVKAELSKITLIFSGRILKDHETLKSHSITNGLTVHLVVRNPRPTDSSATAANQNVSTSPGSAPSPSSSAGQTAPAAGAGTDSNASQPTNPFQAFNMNANNPMNLAQMQQQMMQNPDSMRQLMDTPIARSLLNNPDVMRSLLMESPSMRELMERNPEVGHMLNDPDLMRQTMELVRNPNMFMEMMRNHDRAVSNLEGVPGGMAALQRLYRDVQEPMMNAAQSQIDGDNPFAALRQGTGGGSSTGNSANSDANRSTSARAGQVNSEPLPNPWSSGGGGGGSAGGAANAATRTQPSAGGAANPVGGNQPAAGAGGQSEMMRTLMGNPQIQQMQQQMMQQMFSDPNALRSMMGPNADAINPEMMPQIMEMMRNPANIQAMSNPRVMQALQQIQEGINVLRTEAPHLVPGIGNVESLGRLGGLGGGLGGIGGGGTNPTPATGNTTGGGANPPTTGGNPQEQQAAMASLMASMFQNMGVNNQSGGGPNAVPPEQRFSNELEQLNAMGFTDRQANIRALTATGGNVNLAIERLLGSGGGGGLL